MNILKTARCLEKEEDIEATVQATIVSLLGVDCHFYRQRHSGQQSKRYRWRNVSNSQFESSVSDTHEINQASLSAAVFTDNYPGYPTSPVQIR